MIRSSTAEVLSDIQGPGLVRTIPEWPLTSYLFDSELFQSFAHSLVRLLGFAAQCEFDHPCLIEETKIFRKKEEELRLHILQFKSVRFWDQIQDAVSSHVKKLALRRISELDFDEDLEEVTRSGVVNIDLSRLTTP